jgi:putative heme-binding domain-containing protein
MPRVLCLLGLLACLANSAIGAAEEATPAEKIEIHDGFEVERLLSVPRELGSWVAFCFDSRGRIYASDQGPRLFRITPPPIGSAAEPVVEVVSDVWGHSQGMAFIDGALYSVQHGDHNPDRFRPDLLLRIRDSDSDDRLDTAETLIEFPRASGDAANWYEHSYHAVIPAPDGRSIYLVSGDRNGLPGDRIRTPKLWNRDSWEYPFTAAPLCGGWVARADLDGKNLEVVCMGLRNCYDLAFDHQGDLFTFDSDLENDFGLPNYRPTAIRQILSGSDSGWGGRAGEMLWSWKPDWEEIQPPILDIGPGSPTGICFGHDTAFPSRYREALFVCDWSYGRMFAIHLEPDGATHTAEAEPFLSAQGLPIADVAVSPTDHALYFVTGGRGTQSGLYRVTATSASPAATSPPAPDDATTALRNLRISLERFHGQADPAAVAAAWSNLGHADRAIRAAARAALEWQPVDTWRARALAESSPRTGLQALMSLARVTAGDKSLQPEILRGLARFDFPALSPDEQAWYLRILTISASRHGMFPPEAAAKLIATLEPALPSPDRRVNEGIVALCAALKSPSFIPPTLDLLEAARTQEEQVNCVHALVASAPFAVWTPVLRERFLHLVLDRVPNWKGGFTARAVRDSLLHQVIAMLPPEEQAIHAARIETARKPTSVIPATSRAFVQKWKLEDLVADLESPAATEAVHRGDANNGRKLYAAAACIACHSFQGEGGRAGPDLTTAARRYSTRDLLENILEPSRVINEQYALQQYVMSDGKTFTGRTVNMAGDTVMVATDPNDPGGSEVRFDIHDLESSAPSKISFMPEGLLDTLSRDEIRDLLAYLRSE